jgi:hypothetical protein
LVVEATGRGSRTPAWLDALGDARPEREQVRIGLGYATGTYRLAGDALGGDLAVLHGITPQHPRGGALQVLQDGRWMLTLAGILGDHPPTDPDGFLAFARSLRFPDIYQAIRDAEPLDDPVPFRFPASIRHRSERLDRFPDRLLVLGDAVSSFNPIYGQGMSVAALQALTLRRHLERGVEPQPRRSFPDSARVVDVPWQIAVGGDLVFPAVQGPRTVKVQLLNAYLARLHATAVHDADLASAFVRVAGLVARPESLLRPGVALRVLGQAPLRRRPPAVASSIAAAPGQPSMMDNRTCTLSGLRPPMLAPLFEVVAHEVQGMHHRHIEPAPVGMSTPDSPQRLAGSHQEAVGQRGDRSVLQGPCLPDVGGPDPDRLGVAGHRADHGAGGGDVEHRHRPGTLRREQARPGRVGLTDPLMRRPDLQTGHAAIQRQVQPDQGVSDRDGRDVAADLARGVLRGVGIHGQLVVVAHQLDVVQLEALHLAI